MTIGDDVGAHVRPVSTEGYAHLKELPLRKSKQAAALVKAYRKGYRVLCDGSVVSPSGSTRKPLRFNGAYQAFTVRVGARSMMVAYHQLCAYQKFGDLALRAGVHVRHLDGNPANKKPGRSGLS